MMAPGSSSKYTEEVRRWRDKQRQDDERKKEFYMKIDQYPNLFSLKALFRHRQRAEQLLEKQKCELQAGWFQYTLEVDRCQNLIVFLLYLLGRKKDAIDYCQTLMQESKSDSIIRMTTFAVLQWEMGQREKAKKTVELLHQLSSTSSFRYVKAIAVSEQGHASTYFGPKYFLEAIDKFREALQTFPDSDSYYLWKYDLALAIRRNFNVFVYRVHPTLSAPDLAKEAMTHFRDISTKCPNRFYKARGLTELASLVSSVQQFMTVCDDNDKRLLVTIMKEKEKPLYYIHKALITPEGQNDHFVLRVSGRLFMYEKWYILARKYLEKSLQLRNECITHQLLAKTHLSKYRSNPLNRRRVLQIVGNKPFGHDVCRHDVTEGDIGTKRRSSANQGVLQDSIRPAVQTCSQDTCSLATDFEDSLQIGDRGTSQQGSHHNPMSYPPHACGIKTLLKAFYIANDVYDENDPDVQKAQELFQKALELNPHNTGLLYDAGRMYQGMGKHQKAFELFQNIVSSMDARPTYRVNAYEQSGVSLLALSETAIADEKAELIEKAGDMFRSSMRECQKVVRHLPRVKAELTQVWDSYSKLVQILEASSGDSGVTRLQKMAQAHEEVGKYLEAIKAQHGILDLSKDPHERRQALLGLMRNHCSRDDLTQARLILGVCTDESHFLKSASDDVSCKLRKKAVDVYAMSAHQALKAGQTGSAFLSFQSALVLLDLVKDVPHPSDDKMDLTTDDSEEHAYDICIFDDAEKMYPSDRVVAGDVSSISSVLSTILGRVFGMSVSRNDEEVMLGHLSFEGELQLAKSATTVMLVLGPGNKLSPRMAFLVNTALQNHRDSRVLPVVVADCESTAPFPLDGLQAFPGARDLLDMDTADVDKFMTTLDEHHITILRLFDFVAKTDFAASLGGHRAN